MNLFKNNTINLILESLTGNPEVLNYNTEETQECFFLCLLDLSVELAYRESSRDDKDVTEAD